MQPVSLSALISPSGERRPKTSRRSTTHVFNSTTQHDKAKEENEGKKRQHHDNHLEITAQPIAKALLTRWASLLPKDKCVPYTCWIDFASGVIVLQWIPAVSLVIQMALRKTFKSSVKQNTLFFTSMPTQVNKDIFSAPAASSTLKDASYSIDEGKFCPLGHPSKGWQCADIQKKTWNASLCSRIMHQFTHQHCRSHIRHQTMWSH